MASWSWGPPGCRRPDLQGGEGCELAAALTERLRGRACSPVLSLERVTTHNHSRRLAAAPRVAGCGLYVSSSSACDQRSSPDGLPFFCKPVLRRKSGQRSRPAYGAGRDPDEPPPTPPRAAGNDWRNVPIVVSMAFRWRRQPFMICSAASTLIPEAMMLSTTISSYGYVVPLIHWPPTRGVR